MLSDKKSGNIKAYIALALIIIFQVGRLVYSFIYLKEDYHSDEMWSFGLSNSYYQPYIYENSNRSEYINHKTWFSSKAMRDYLTVDKSQRFSYDSVYYNQVHDDHPPLYYFILHTICSLFPGRFSLWFGFAINIIAFTGTIYYLYRLIFELSQSAKVSLIGCSFYGFSAGALNTFEFIRMYSLETVIAVMFFYYHSRFYHSETHRKYKFGLFFVTLMGCLTHHFFVPFAGFTALCFCMYYIIKKKYKLLLNYSLIMFSSVASSVILFPATINHVFSGRINDAKYPFNWQVKITLSCMTSELFGLNIPVVSKYSFTANLIAVTCVVVIVSPLLFLFRKEIWFRKIISFIKKGLFVLRCKIRHIDLMIISMMTSILGTILVTVLTVSNIHMGQLTDRYIFHVFPAMITVFVLILYGVLKNIPKKLIADIFLIVVCSFFCIVSNILGPINYFFTKEEGSVSVKSLIKDSNCVFISDNFWLMTCFTRLSMDADHIYALTGSELSQNLKSIQSPPDPEKKCYYYVEEEAFFIDNEEEVLHGQMPERFMVKDQSDKLKQSQFESILKAKYSKCEYIGFDNMFERKFLIYRVN